MGNSKSSKYFAANPEARKKKNEYNKEYHATPERKKYRAELNRENRRRGVKGDGKDMSHTKSGKMVLESESKNRSRNGKGNKSSKK